MGHQRREERIPLLLNNAPSLPSLDAFFLLSFFLSSFFFPFFFFLFLHFYFAFPEARRGEAFSTERIAATLANNRTRV